jgi:hypothetical protein
LWLVLWLFTSVSAFDAWRRAPAGEAKRQGAAFAAAYVTQDLLLFVWLASATFAASSTPYVLQVTGPAFAALAFDLLLGYGILRSQLFDVDLKIKWTIRRGTVAAVFVGVFLVVAQIAQNYLAGAFGWLAGGLAAGGLLLVLRPIERAADRVADRAMPRVHDTDEYRTVRKRAVYRAAIEGALEDGDVSPKERAMLARLADQLDLGPLEMHDIEREARRARVGAAA